MEKLINEFVKIPLLFKNGYGNGNGNGKGYGDGYGYGYGNGNGNGKGYGDGYGYGDGDGNGYGNGKGDGYGYGYGDGNGYGNGKGDGYGYGYGDGIISLNNQKIYMIDKVQTIITNIKNNIGKGFIVNNDLTLSSCYIVKQDNLFSHGKTIKEALTSLQKKLLDNTSIEERIIKFKEKFKDFAKKYKAIDLYNWHGILTNSCNFGRESFIKNNNIDLKKDKFTIYEFIKLTENQYNGEIIKQLKTK